MPGFSTWLTIGFIIIMIGFIIIFVGAIYSSSQQSNQKTEVGGVIMIGPIPIIFGNSWKAATIAIAFSYCTYDNSYSFYVSWKRDYFKIIYYQLIAY
jgi:Predicted membrane protein